MKICEGEVKSNPIDVKRGDCLKNVRSGDYYLVVYVYSELRLCCLADGLLWNSRNCFGNVGQEGFIKVNGCFKVES